MNKILNFVTIVYLFMFSLYHFTTGIISVFLSKFALKLNKFIYGFRPIEENQLLLTFKPWGNLALAIGIIGFITLFNINYYYPIMFAFVVLLTIRAGYRIILRRELKTIFKIKPSQNWRMIIIQIIGATIFLTFIFSKII